MVIPKQHLIVEGLNSYYLDVSKLIDHYKWSDIAGCIQFNSKHAEGTIFFGFNDLISAYFQDAQGSTYGTQAVEKIKESARDNYFIVNVYSMPDNMLLFWANIPRARTLYENLSTDLTDLDKLITKMTSEGVTGYIEMTLRDSDENAMLFFHQGDLIGGSCSWADNSWTLIDNGLSPLQERLEKSGGVFHVKSLPLEDKVPEETPAEQVVKRSSLNSEEVLPMLSEMLSMAESLIADKSKSREGFEVILRKKLIDKAEEYPFLDPFADEFAYSHGEIRFDGDASAPELAAALQKCLFEIADERKLRAPLERELMKLHEKYGEQLSACLPDL